MRKSLAAVLALIGCVAAYAMPARRGGHVEKQADGTEITVYQHGDEHFHWKTNAQGQWIEKQADGNYAVVPALTEEQITARREASPKRKEQIRRMRQQEYPLNIAPKGLVILVNFKDKQFTTSIAEIDSMCMGHNYTRHYNYDYVLYGDRYKGTVDCKGSARQFFYDSSHGQYNPQFDVIGPVTVSNNMEYYGGNDKNGNDLRPEAMIKEACQLADKAGVDFTQYDHNGDGKVDFVYVFYAGEGEADGGDVNTIWPHSWSLAAGGVSIKLDGKIIDTYACGNEMNHNTQVHDGIGTICHEFSHVLGLPDIYETTGEGDWKTSGEWDLMDYGPYNNEGNTPPSYTGYERFFMGWATPRVLNNPEDVTLHELNASNEVLLITKTGTHNLKGNDPNPTTFWVLENRQQTGWDEFLPGHGMLVTKINYSYSKWDGNTVNNTQSSLGVDIVEADGNAPSYSGTNSGNGYFGKAGDAFPTGSTSFKDVSAYPVTSIAEQNGVITFRLGDNTPTPPGPGGACDTYNYTFTAKCLPGEKAMGDYSWEVSITDASYTGYDSSNNRGAQFGSTTSPAKQVSLTTNETVECEIDKVTVNAAMGSSGNAKLAVYIGLTQIGTTQSLSTTSTNYTFANTNKVHGALEVRLTNSQKAMYLKTINVTYSSPTTEIENIESRQDTAQKIIEDGQIIIVRNGKKYTLTGIEK